MRLWLTLSAVVLSFLTGCSMDPGKTLEVAEVNGVAKYSDGTPVKGLTLMFLPTVSGQLPSNVKLGPDGTFKCKLAPGKYTIVLEGTGSPIPPAYATANAANTAEVSGSELTVTITK